jgi:hypothetical protein
VRAALVVVGVGVLCIVAVYLVLRWQAPPPTPPHAPIDFGHDPRR